MWYTDKKGGILMTYEELKQKMDEAHYIYDETLATVLYVCFPAIGAAPAHRGRGGRW